MSWKRWLLLLTNTRSLEVIHNLLSDLGNESWIQLTSCIRAFEGMVYSVLDRRVLLIYAGGSDSIRVAAWPGAAIVVRLGLLRRFLPAEVEAVSSRLHGTVAVSRCHADQRHLLVTVHCVHDADALIEFQEVLIRVVVVVSRVEGVVIELRLSALSGADTAMRYDASVVRGCGDLAQKYGQVDEEGASPQCYAVQRRIKKAALFLCFGCSSLLDRLLGSLDGGSRQGARDSLGVLDEPLVVIDMAT